MKKDDRSQSRLGLTTNMQWQISRNARLFNSETRLEHQTVQNATAEWQERKTRNKRRGLWTKVEISGSLLLWGILF